MPERRGRLVVVGTPIGNLEDLSPRARRALESADAIYCEDTRVTAKLAARFGLAAPRVASPEPRERQRAGELLARLAAGETVAFVSDAGMPGISDPGRWLVAAAAEAGFPVEVVPGPSAPAAALAVSGLSGVPHLFLGFLPAREGGRRRALEALRERPETLLWFEAPHRIAASLEDAARILGPRRAALSRELTKAHEEILRGTLVEIARRMRERGTARGEITVVCEGAAPEAAPALSGSDLDGEIRARLAQGIEKRRISRELAGRAGLPAREIYARAVALDAVSRPPDGGRKASRREPRRR
jgi:16S rRNA (cytidine1402-2'-O)-methyltransferase